MTPVDAAVINGSFETEDFPGWTQTIAGGGQQVVTSRDGVNFTSTGTKYSPVNGRFFAVLGAGDGNSLVSIEQDLPMGIGDILSGWAFFSSNEFVPSQGTDPNDFASVEVLDSSGVRVARPFYLDSDTIGGLVDGRWTPWSFTASTADAYTLRLGVTNVPDEKFPSEAGFDDIHLQRVPEPSTLVALFLGLAASGVRRRRARG